MRVFVLLLSLWAAMAACSMAQPYASVPGYDLVVGSATTNSIARYNVSNGVYLSNYFVGSQNLLSGPTYMAVLGDDLFVSCQTNNAILRYPNAISTQMLDVRESLFSFAKTPYGLAIHPTTGNMYVASHTQNLLYVVNGEDWQQTNEIPTPHQQPTEILFSPFDGLLYVLSLSGTLTPFNITTNEFLPDVLNPIFSDYDTYPLCMAFSTNGTRLYIATQQSTVLAFDAENGFTPLGVFINWQFGGPTGYNSFIMGIRVNPLDELLYVVDTFTNNVFRYSQRGEYLGQLVTPPSGSSNTSDSGVDLWGLLFSSDGSMFLSEYATNSVIMYMNVTTDLGTVPMVFDTGGSGLNTPVDIEIDNNDNVYVVSLGSHEVFIVDAQGNATLFISARSGGLLAPYAIEFIDNTCIVSSNGNAQILQYDMQGNFLRVFADDLPFSPLDLLVDEKRNITYVATLTRILMYDSRNGDYVVSFSYIDFDENGNILASDRFNSRILWFPVTNNGEFGGTYTLFAAVSVPRDLLSLNHLTPSVVLVTISIQDQIGAFFGTGDQDAVNTDYLQTTCNAPTSLSLVPQLMVPPVIPTNDISPMVIAMAVLGSTIIIICIVVGLYCFFRWRKKAMQSRLDLEKAGAAYKELPDSVRHSYVNSPMLKQAQMEGWLIAPNQIAMQEMIARGASGEVWRGSWRKQPVAVKKLFIFKAEGADDLFQEFIDECSIMSKLRHPNVCQFLGASVAPPALCLITEFMKRGSLYDVLHDSKQDLDWYMRLRMARDMASGMVYLHSSSPPIIHRDLKSPNFLVDEYYNVKVADFGASRVKAEAGGTMTSIGTPAWTAPEVLMSTGYSEKADVYSFGVVLWELLTREDPYKGIETMQICLRVLSENLRPKIPEGTDDRYKRLIEGCWAKEPSHRPTFEYIIDEIDLCRQGR